MAVSAGHRADVFWATDASPRMDRDKRAGFAIRGDGEFHVYRVDLRKRTDWMGQVFNILRIDPAAWDNPGKQSERFSIDHIRGARE